MVAGGDGDGSVPAGGLDEALDGPAGGLLDPVRDRHRGEHDGQVGLDGVLLAVIDRPGSQVGLGHAEGPLDLEQAPVGADDLLGVRVGQVGDVGLPPRQGFRFLLQFPVDRASAAGELDEPVALERGLAGDSGLGLGDLGLDALERAPAAVVGVLVERRDVFALGRGAAGPPRGQREPVGYILVGVVLAPLLALLLQPTRWSARSWTRVSRRRTSDDRYPTWRRHTCS